MSELVSFLLARLDEDEAVARSRRRLRPEFRGRRVEGGGAEPDWLRIDGQAVHIDDAMEPVPPTARVLVEVEAKRAILDVHFGSYGDEGRWWCNACADGAYGDKADWPCPTLRLLALPFADHPDYDETWRP